MPIKRSLGLDLLRIFAAGWVVLFHWTAQYNEALPSWYIGFARGGYLGVDLFFFLSGAVIIHTAMGRSWGDFARSRFLRLFPAFIGVSLLWLIIRAAMGNPITSDNIAALTGLVFWKNGNYLIGPSWTLGYEIGFYVLVAILIAISRNALTPQRVRVGSYVFLIVFLVAGFSGSTALKVVALDPYGPMFILGALLGLSFDRAELRANLPGIALAAALSFWTLLARTGEMGVTGATQIVWTLAMLLLPSAVILWSSMRPATRTRVPWLRRQIEVVALMTYAIYLLHFEIGQWIIAQLRVFDWPIELAIFTGGVVVLALSWLSVTFYEPAARRLISRVFGWPTRSSTKPPEPVSEPATLP